MFYSVVIPYFTNIIYQAPIVQSVSALDFNFERAVEGLVSVGEARSLDQTALRPSVIKRICHIDVKYITHTASQACG